MDRKLNRQVKANVAIIEYKLVCRVNTFVDNAPNAKKDQLIQEMDRAGYDTISVHESEKYKIGGLFGIVCILTNMDRWCVDYTMVFQKKVISQMI